MQLFGVPVDGLPGDLPIGVVYARLARRRERKTTSGWPPKFAVRPAAGGRNGGILPLPILWRERAVRSVANLTRRDAEELLALAPRLPVRTSVRELPLERANEAFGLVRSGEVQGSIALRVTADGG